MQKPQRVLLFVVIVVLVAIVMGYGGCTCKKTQPVPNPMCAQYAFSYSPGAPLAPLADNCQPQGCGLNGTWLGKGVAFRTLHLDGAANPQGIQYRGFKSKNGTDLLLRVDGDQIKGIDANHPSSPPLTGTALEGAVLHLFNSHPHKQYTLRFVKVTQTSFWAKCPQTPPSTSCASAPSSAWLYQFTVTVDGDGCEVQLCKPGLDDNYSKLEGTAVIFRGDLYDDKTYEVKLPDTANPAENDIINIACTGTAISKLHLFRHTSASMGGSNYVSVAQRQSLLRLLTADYCGVGYPFTEDNLPIGINFGYFDLTPGYPQIQATSTDARWNATRASCIGEPRLLKYHQEITKPQLLGSIDQKCAEFGKSPHVDCAFASVVPSGYPVSTNP